MIIHRFGLWRGGKAKPKGGALAPHPKRGFAAALWGLRRAGGEKPRGRWVNNTFCQDVGAEGALECGDYSPLWGVAGRKGEARKRRISAALQGRLRRRFHGDCGVPVGRSREAGG